MKISSRPQPVYESQLGKAPDVGACDVELDFNEDWVLVYDSEWTDEQKEALGITSLKELYGY